jgi:hypothetical protein
MSDLLLSLGCALVIALLLIAVDHQRDRRARRRQLARRAPLRTWLGR